MCKIGIHFIVYPQRNFSGEDDRYLHVTLPVVAFIEMLAKSVVSRATTATRAGYVQRRIGQTTLLGCGSINASEDDPAYSS